jgi:hypothetical protein
MSDTRKLFKAYDYNLERLANSYDYYIKCRKKEIDNVRIEVFIDSCVYSFKKCMYILFDLIRKELKAKYLREEDIHVEAKELLRTAHKNDIIFNIELYFDFFLKFLEIIEDSDKYLEFCKQSEEKIHEYMTIISDFISESKNLKFEEIKHY